MDRREVKKPTWEVVKVGQKPRLTPERHDTIVKALTAGAYASNAYSYAGISSTTYYRWLARGIDDQEAGKDTRYSQFRAAVQKAEAESELRAVTMVQAAMGSSWQAAMTYLERKFPERWGRRQRVEIEVGAGSVPEIIPVSGREFRKRVARLAEYAESIAEDEDDEETNGNRDSYAEPGDRIL